MNEKITDIALSRQLSKEIGESYTTGLEFMTSNPEYALLKFRDAVEILVSLLEERNQLELRNVSLFERINILSKSQIVSNPMGNDLHLVRKLGNVGAHSSELKIQDTDFANQRQNILQEKATEARKALVSAFENAFFIIFGRYAASRIGLVSSGQQEFREIIYNAFLAECHKTKLKAGIICESIYKDLHANSPLLITQSLSYHLEGIEMHAIHFYDSACKISANIDLQLQLQSFEIDIERTVQQHSDVEALFRYASLTLSLKDDVFSKDLSMARLRSAADRNYLPAQALFGAYLYQKREFELALHYLYLAEMQDEPLALRFLFYYFSDGEACAQDILKALEFLNRGIELGCADCEAVLGSEFHKGNLVDKNDVKAKEYLENSILAGSAIGKSYMMIEFNDLAGQLAEKAKAFAIDLEQAIGEKKPKPFRAESKVPQNSPCPCGSGVKYKKCCKNKRIRTEDVQRYLSWL
ncbi:DUF4145 domain-containing protein [Vibrio cholerae]|uniref:DUF4145 domain-containing protein n=1 Tax=Vibrio cholerae TaxID=666 RepID=UPI00226EA1FB|nr:DUF4145 domain-containing protein [Vibrio cholerae]EGR2849133.1 DUF4145 domain-containing protein [Vibrio cholerae]EGR4278671.1 DUF4145 domain-containing protein [Vibrio cholerae]EJK2191449.1 DUF4145 domain-containing protein [Vibrio cholerae]EKF9248590.1 DUF4145 domain-containing protein [Vibrio cholerae]EKF9773061.1 DUF4145 domain-containing protein [Vibrio cholerae]